MKKVRKIVAGVLGTLLMFSAISVAAVWEPAGYDTTNPPNFGKIYNEVIGGNFTSNQKIEPLPEESIEWKMEGYELDYPHAGYDRLYLEGNAQSGITRYNNLFPQWETKWQDYMWEVCWPYQIWQRQQTNIPGYGWRWDFGNDRLGISDSVVFVPTTRQAQVSADFKAQSMMGIGFNGYNITDPGILEMYEQFHCVPNYFNVKIDENGNYTKEIVDGDFFSDENLSEKDHLGRFLVTDEEIQAMVDVVETKYVTGPSFNGENPTKDVAAMYVENRDKGWRWDEDTARLNHNAEISWTNVYYEMEEPYLYYQYLVVNGLVLDGRGDTPRVFRYTGGKAAPKVEWRYQWPEAQYPYNVVELKYLDGKPAYHEDGTPYYRFPTGEFGNAYIKVTDTEIQLWVKDAKGDYQIDTLSRVDGDFGGGFRGYVPAAGYMEY